MVEYTTTSRVYNLIGVDNTAITDNVISDFIEQATVEAERLVKSTCIPQIITKRFAGNGTDTAYLPQVPLLNLYNLIIDGVTVSPKYCQFNQTGEVYLTTTAESRAFSATKNSCIAKYLYGWLENDKEVPQEVTATDLTAGNNRSLIVTDGRNYLVGEYFKIEDLDGNYEVVRVKTCDLVGTAPGYADKNTITFDLVLDHDTGSTITKVCVPKIMSNLVSVLAAIKGAGYMLGSTYTFATNYSMPDYSITKGQPLAHFRENLQANIQLRDKIIGEIGQWPVYA